jgi:telomere length regulation protein
VIACRFSTHQSCSKKVSGDGLVSLSVPVLIASFITATAQVILLAVGYLHRMKSEMLTRLPRSSQYLHAVSNRLGASLPRARFLGMIVGTAVSRLVDAPDKAMKFDMEEMESDDARRFLGLVNIADKIGDVEDLKRYTTMTKPASTRSSKIPKQEMREAPKKGPSNYTSKIISIEEVEGDEKSDDGLIPYQKPDDDPSDSDEDPTLINRSKPKAPVYISELVKALQANDKPDTVELALKAAPGLIRRKTGFGTELSENINDLTTALINVQEGMSKESTQHLRLRSLIACLVAQPAKIGPWFASLYFEGDFSLAQRASLLTAIGLGARELAGHSDDPDLTTDRQQSSFPSQRLPNNLAAIYAPVDNIARQLEHTTLQPMALAAADKLTGPDILKVRTFSSRLSVEKKTAQRAKDRQTRIPKDLHKLLAESIYLPLCCRMSLLLSSRPNTNTTTLFEPHILRLFLQTLTIVLTTLGPHALQLYTATRETLLLLTSLHMMAKLSTDAVVLPALLQLLLSVLDLNVAAGAVSEERLVTEFGNMIGELVAWAGNLGNVVNVPEMGQGEMGMGMPWTVLVAGVQVKWHEVGRKFQGRMIGLAGADLDGFGG